MIKKKKEMYDKINLLYYSEIIKCFKKKILQVKTCSILTLFWIIIYVSFDKLISPVRYFLHLFFVVVTELFCLPNSSLISDNVIIEKLSIMIVFICLK